jgi:hypothetical protein
MRKVGTIHVLEESLSDLLDSLEDAELALLRDHLADAVERRKSNSESDDDDCGDGWVIVVRTTERDIEPGMEIDVTLVYNGGGDGVKDPPTCETACHRVAPNSGPPV